MSNVQRGGEGGPLQWWTSIPPITRYYATTCLLTSVGAHYGFVPIYSCVLLWPKILRLEVRTRKEALVAQLHCEEGLK